MDRRSLAKTRQDAIVTEFLANKAIANSGVCPSNTPSTNQLTYISPTKGKKVLPPIKASTSLD